MENTSYELGYFLEIGLKEWLDWLETTKKRQFSQPLKH